ncbi:MAG: sugar transferase [bacterium]
MREVFAASRERRTMSMRRNFVREGAFWLAALDVVCLVAAVAAGIIIRGWLGPSLGLVPLENSVGDYFSGHMDGWFLFCAAIVVGNYVGGNYSLQSTVYRFNLLVNWLFSLAIGLLVISVTSLAWFEMLLGRGVLLFAIVAYAAFTLGAKALVYEILPKSSMFVCRTVVLGTGKNAQAVRKMVEGGYVIPRHVVCGYISIFDGPGDIPSDIDGAPVVKTTANKLAEVASGMNPDIIIMGSGSRDDMMACFPALWKLRFGGVEVLDLLGAVELYNGRVPLELVDEAWLMQASMAPSMAVVRRVKRLFDVAVTALMSLILAPAGLAVALLVKLSAPFSPMLYAQDRVGQFGKIFRMYKFRTMIVNAEAPGQEVWSPNNDPRVTRVGRLLRKFRLDEIPQVWNVLRGDMSLVGPRPERPGIVADLERRIPNYRERENVPPGITGWAQVRYTYVNTVDDVARKLEFDLYYIKTLSIRLDFQILLRTIRIVVFGMER